MAFSLEQSRLDWARKEKYRYAKWRLYVRTRKAGDAKRTAEYKLWQEAVKWRKKREAQLATLPITRVDHDGDLFIMEAEGVIPYVYNDSQGHATVGVGHLLHLGNYTAADARKWGTIGHQKYTKSEFVAFFQKDIEPYEKAVVKAFTGTKLKITQKMFNAAVSMCFNIGIGGLLSSTFAREVRAGNKRAAADAMLKWNKPPEIIGRRQKEHALFLHG